MPVNIPEVLNNLFQGQPQIERGLLAMLPNVKLLTISPALVVANTSVEQTFTLNSIAVGDFVYATKPSLQVGLSIIGGRVTAANTIGIGFINSTGAGITPTAGETYLVLHAPGLFSGRSNFIP
jgi:hypothetical protein